MINFSCFTSNFSVNYCHLCLKTYTQVWNNSNWSSFGIQSSAQSMASLPTAMPRFQASWWIFLWCFRVPDRMLAGRNLAPKLLLLFSSDCFHIKLNISNARELLAIFMRWKQGLRHKVHWGIDYQHDHIPATLPNVAVKTTPAERPRHSQD